ncbi:MAG: Mammalian cell entry related domain protein, partial [Pedosphaera sp.]|nr:Mammalian cell entry related domain protein [Pedosphaera sp.]
FNVMNQSRLEVKVGLFVLICLVLLAVLLLQFSKGVTFFRKTYTVILNTGNVGGLKPKASVLMSGVQVGTVSQTLLSPQGTNVSIYLTIFGQFVIRSNALFKIEQSGFLGDQYVAIYPGPAEAVTNVMVTNQLPSGEVVTKEVTVTNRFGPLENGNEVYAEPPFNLQEVARTTSGFIQRMDNTVKKVDDAITDVRRLVLNENTLTNLSVTVQNLKKVSEDAIVTVGNVNGLITTNAAPASAAISNLVVFSDRLNAFGMQAQGILGTNGPAITAAIENLRASTATLTNLLGGVDAGHGLAGTLFKDQVVASNVASIANNLAVTTSNLNRLGLWHFIWYHPKPEQPSK